MEIFNFRLNNFHSENKMNKKIQREYCKVEIMAWKKLQI